MKNYPTQNLTINEDLLIELLKLGIEHTRTNQLPIESYHSHSSYMSQGIKANWGFIRALCDLLKSKNEDFNYDLFQNTIENGSSDHQDEMKEKLLSIIGVLNDDQTHYILPKEVACPPKFW